MKSKKLSIPAATNLPIKIQFQFKNEEINFPSMKSTVPRYIEMTVDKITTTAVRLIVIFFSGQTILDASVFTSRMNFLIFIKEKLVVCSTIAFDSLTDLELLIKAIRQPTISAIFTNLYGRPGGTRTPNIRIWSPALYH